MRKISFGFFGFLLVNSIVSIASLSESTLFAQSCPRYVEQGRVLQQFHAEGPTQRECQECCCWGGIGVNVGCCGVCVPVPAIPCVQAGIGCPCCNTRCVPCCSSSCHSYCAPNCCRSPCCPPFRPQRCIRPVRPYYGYTCCNAPIYDDSDKEDVYIPEQNAYWPTKKTDSWMRELQW